MALLLSCRSMAVCSPLIVMWVLMLQGLPAPVECTAPSTTPESAIGWDNKNMEINFQDLQKRVERRNAHVREMASQLIQHQHRAEQRVRAQGNSGIMQTRNFVTGSQNYHAYSYTGTNFAGTHDHIGYMDMVGFGENTMVMNGVQFTTAHSDYCLVRPSTTSKEWHATDHIEPPEVPESVTSLDNITEQVLEMQEYFRAFRDMNETHRPFKKYFKPLFCYMEGTWLRDWINVEQASETHNRYNYFAAYHWEDLREMSRMEAALGSHLDGNVATLPRAVMGLDENGFPIYAQWHYRYLCYPFEYDDIPQHYFRVVDDLSYRMNYKKSREDYFYSKGARFIIDEGDEPAIHEGETRLDELVSQIPGADNNNVDFINEFPFWQKNTTDEDGNLINLAHYNRKYQAYKTYARAAGFLRGFTDTNLFVSMTQQREALGPQIDFSKDARRHYEFKNLSVTYLLPVEVIYVTPLLSWNPYDLRHYGGDAHDPDVNMAKWNNAKGTKEEPYWGTNYMLFYRTPTTFFDRVYSESRTFLDIGVGSTFVNDKKNETVEVAASGIRSVTPPISNGVGPIRMRYPIMPVHGEGSAVWKELNAFKVYLTEQIATLGRQVLAHLDDDSES